MMLSLGSDPVNVFKNTLLPSIKRSKFKYLGAAIALYVASRVYNAFGYPRKFRHIKRIPLLPMLKSLIAADNDLEQTRKFVLPRWEDSNGVIAYWGQFGWAVRVTNPEAVRTILYKTGMCITYAPCSSFLTDISTPKISFQNPLHFMIRNTRT
jgi:hypothetical protein